MELGRDVTKSLFQSVAQYFKLRAVASHWCCG